MQSDNFYSANLAFEVPPEMTEALFFRVILPWLCIGFAAAVGQPSSIQQNGRVACIVVVASLLLWASQGQCHEASPHIERTRRPVRQIFREMGPCCFRRAYRMDQESFWVLH